jgi:hypothetical protein
MELLQYEVEINQIKDDPYLLQESSKHRHSNSTIIYSRDGLQRPGKLPPIKEKNSQFNRNKIFNPPRNGFDVNDSSKNYYNTNYGKYLV